MSQEFPDFRRPQIVKTSALRIPNEYTLAIDNELREFAINEERAPEFLGKWRSEAFKVSEEIPMDLEIGTGNGVHFRTRCLNEPSRRLVGIELKYKPLVQTVRGMLRLGAENGKVCRAHAFNIDTLFAAGELNHIFMHFPDPWTNPRKPNNRMVNARTVQLFSRMQREGSIFELKTDSSEYFDWACEHFAKSSDYELIFKSRDWHAEERAQGALRTQFEKIFVAQGLPIYFAEWRRKCPSSVS